MKNKNNLKLISVLHYVCAGCFAVVGILAFPFMTALIFGSAEILKDPNRVPNPSESLDSWGAIFGISALYILWWIGAIALFLAGTYLRKRKARTFCMIVAAIECLLFIPLGTVLGVFTIISLNKNSSTE
jgi:hypothetical protein